MSEHCNGDNNSYSFFNGEEIFKFKTDNKNINFPTTNNGIGAIDSREVSLKGNVYMILQSITMLLINLTY